MKSAAMTFAVVPAMLIPLAAALFVAGGVDACATVPTMTWAEACLKSSRTPSQYNLCQETLQHAPDRAEATVYAAVTANAAKLSYEATTAEAESQLVHGARHGYEMAALQRCAFESSVARKNMLCVIDDMSRCEFGNTVGEYADATSAVEVCADALSSGFPGSSLVAMNAADRDITTVARALGSLAIPGNARN